MPARLGDIFYAKPEFELPEKVYILGSGPLGVDGYDRIDGYTIGLNKSVSAVPCDLWMSFATGYLTHKAQWFRDLLDNDKTPRLFGSHPENNAGLADREDCDYSFLYYPPWQHSPFMYQGVLKAATIAGAALQLAYWFGASEVYLCGVDMFGAFDFTGQAWWKGRNEPTPTKDNKSWPVDLEMIDKIIHAIRDQVTVYTLTPTALGKPIRTYKADPLPLGYVW